MAINIRQKGAEGEREVVKLLTAIIVTVMRDLKYPEDEIIAAEKSVQRNQNQTAVGGNDLNNTFGMSFEVKRQEQLAINTWWEQCCVAAKRNDELPVLIWRQNGKKWQVRTFTWLPVPQADGSWGHRQIVSTFDVETFKEWFAEWVRGKLQSGHKVTT